jgi:pimeloyl-ACP methyl ester carboxylesterase
MQVRPFAGLSPRRRALLTAVTAATALLAVAVVALVVGPRLFGPTRPVPPQDRPGPVLLVPGFGGGTGGLSVLAGRLRAAGREATVVQLPDDATGDLHDQAAVLDRYATEALRAGAPSVDVVGHSAGGVVARLWAQDHDGAHKARRIITLGSPHHGADLAAAGTAVGPGACPVACQQLAPGNRFLAGLDTPVHRPPQWLALWTTQDETVTPVESARLEGAVNVAVQWICPAAVLSHGDLPTSPLVTRFVLAAIGPGPVTAPGPRTC